MDMKAMLEKAHADTMHHTSLMLAAQELESATYAARQAREKLRRGTRNRLQAKERHADALRLHSENDVREDDSRLWTRVEVLRWALENAERDEHDALNDYRDALKRLEVLGGTVGEADSHEVPGMVRHRARKAIALADAFGNKVAMDATLHDGLERPVLPELEPEVEVQEFRVIDPLEPVEARPAPETRAVLVPVEQYSAPEAGFPVKVTALWETEEGIMVQGTLPDAVAEKIAEGRLGDVSVDEDPDEPEHMSPEWWKRVTYSAPLNVKDPLPKDEDENLAPVCPECKAGKHGNCDGTAWDDHEDAPASCQCADGTAAGWIHEAGR